MLGSDDRNLWKEAIQSMHHHIAMLERKVREAAANDAENANFLVTELWAWNSARRQLCARFGSKFILPSLHSHEEKSDEPL